MGNYSFTNFKDYVKITLGNRTGLGTYLPLWVNGAYVELCSINKFPVGRRLQNLTFPELDTFDDSATIDGTPYIARPDRCLHIHTVWDMSNDSGLSERPRNWYVEQTGRATASSEDEPSYWIPGVYPKRTYLYPTPDSAYNMRTYFRKRPSRLVNNGDTTAIGEEWDEAILALASAKAHMWLRDFENAKMWRSEFASIVSSLLGMTNKEQQDVKHYFRPDPAYIDFSYRK